MGQAEHLQRTVAFFNISENYRLSEDDEKGARRPSRKTTGNARMSGRRTADMVRPENEPTSDYLIDVDEFGIKEDAYDDGFEKY